MFNKTAGYSCGFFSKIKFIIMLNNVGIWLILQISKTWRITTQGNIPQPPAIIAFWHGYMLPVWKYFSDKNPSALISQSKDGEILAAILEK